MTHGQTDPHPEQDDPRHFLNPTRMAYRSVSMLLRFSLLTAKGEEGQRGRRILLASGSGHVSLCCNSRALQCHADIVSGQLSSSEAVGEGDKANGDVGGAARRKMMSGRHAPKLGKPVAAKGDTTSVLKCAPSRLQTTRQQRPEAPVHLRVMHDDDNRTRPSLLPSRAFRRSSQVVPFST